MLSSELDLWESYWKDESKAKRNIPDIMDTIIELSERNRKTWYHNIYTIYVLVAVVPGSSCSCERCISKLRLLKTYLWSTMSQERLNGLALLFSHLDIEINYEKLLNIFARDYRHRLQLVNMLSKT